MMSEEKCKGCSYFSSGNCNRWGKPIPVKEIESELTEEEFLVMKCTEK
ncbi:hypothetical protein M0R19_08455 [Candidatus Pacearchaeota archaeon]|nr:hypothetical protein [bacterium]MCK9597188.1 hypothetical protein [Candidatus Pacearchaeota archaeon]